MGLLLRAMVGSGHHVMLKAGDRTYWHGLEVLRLGAGESWEAKLAEEAAAFLRPGALRRDEDERDRQGAGLVSPIDDHLEWKAACWEDAYREKILSVADRADSTVVSTLALISMGDWVFNEVP